MSFEFSVYNTVCEGHLYCLSVRIVGIWSQSQLTLGQRKGTILDRSPIYSNLNHSLRRITIHSHSYTYRQEWPNNLTSMCLDCMRKPEYW